MDSKNKGFYEYGLIPSDEPHSQHKQPVIDVESAPTKVEKGKKKKEKGKFFRKKTFWICFSNIHVGSNQPNEKIMDEEKKGEFKVKDKILFSNVDNEPDEVLAAVENMRNKSCLLICFSNIQVAKGKEQKG